MKVILNIEENVLSDMQLIADIQHTEFSKLIEETFIKYVKEPKIAMHEVYNEDQILVEFMQELLFHHLTKYIKVLEDLENETNKRDKRVIKLFKTIRDEILNDDRIILKLYSVFKSVE